MNKLLLAIVAKEPTADVRPERYSEWNGKDIKYDG